MKTGLLLYLCALHALCGIAQVPPVHVSYKNYRFDRSLPADSNIVHMLQPYNDSVAKVLQTVIGFSNTTLYKKQPTSPLGNVVADCLQTAAAKAVGTPVDAAFINIGSLRANLPKGNITIASAYNILPFENEIVLLHVSGNVLHQLLDLIAYKGGWPCAGVTMKIENKAAKNIMIKREPLQDTAAYLIAVPDYLANGGDGCRMLANAPEQATDLLCRDAFIEYIKSFTAAGKPLSSPIENRIENAGE